MRCDVIAEGVVAAITDVGLKVPLVVRLEGTNVELGKQILRDSGLAVVPADDLADAAHYPAIDLNGSISRVMQNLLSPEELKQANRLRRLWSLYQQNRDLISVGAYEAGSNADIDLAILMRNRLEDFLRQDMHAGVDSLTTRRMIGELMAV
jgi:flagellar biosynthesis/type III secretory pathway ATPase